MNIMMFVLLAISKCHIITTIIIEKLYNNKTSRAGPQLWYEIWFREQNVGIERAMANH